MRRWRDLSLSYKIPLRVGVLVLGTALVVTGSLIYREADELKQTLLANAEATSRLLSKTLVAPMVQDDVWRVYELINAPRALSSRGDYGLEPELIVVLDSAGRVYVSTEPGQFPMGAAPSQGEPSLRAVLAVYQGREILESKVVQPPDSDGLYMVAPIIADGVPLGSLVLGYSKAKFLPRYYDLAERAAVVTLLVLLVLLPIGAFLGHRTGAPLVGLSEAMARVGKELPGEKELPEFNSRDEIGQLGVAFTRMVSELKEKASLEQQVVVSERLAALGRLAAGVAHEINNPLGGMLNAISTLKRHGANDPLTARTVSLLERGLNQIKDTVAALLVEARVETHPLTSDDIEDIRTLVLADAHRKNASLRWENDIHGVLPLPSTLVRQVMINLLLNALQAIAPGGQVYCHAYRAGPRFMLLVTNDGEHIPEERIPLLFEPFSHWSEGGHGLGLWVTYQIVRQLNGGLAVDSRPGETRFSVELPLDEAGMAEIAA